MDFIDGTSGRALLPGRLDPRCSVESSLIIGRENVAAGQKSHDFGHSRNDIGLMPLKPIAVDSFDPTIYCTIADWGETATHRITPSWLTNALKVDSILRQHVYVSASHLFSSDMTANALETLAPLVEGQV